MRGFTALVRKVGKLGKLLRTKESERESVSTHCNGARCVSSSHLRCVSLPYESQFQLLSGDSFSSTSTSVKTPD